MQSKLAVKGKVRTPSLDNPLVWGPLGALIIAIASVLLRFPFLSLPLTSDEGAYAYVAYFWSQGHELYDDTLLIFRPQAILVIYRAVFATLGTDVEDIRLFAGIYNALTLLFVYLSARQVLNTRYSLLAASFFAFFSVSRIIEGFTANGEIFLNLPATVSAFILLRSGRSLRPFGWYCAAGLFAGIATQIKPSGLASLILGVTYGLYLVTGRDRRPVMLWLAKAELGLFLGFLASLVPALLHGWMIGWDRFVYASIGFSLTHSAPTSYPIGLHLLRFLDSIGYVMRECSFLLFAGAARLVVLPVRRFSGNEPFLWLWLFSTGLGIASGGSWWLHYYLQALPPASIIAAVGLNACLGRGRLHIIRLALGVAVITALLTSLREQIPVFFRSTEDIQRQIWAINTNTWGPQVAEYISERTGPEDKIFVMNSDPEIYFLARRQPAYKYLFFSPTELPRVPEAPQELAAILEDSSRAPVYMVLPGERIYGIGLEPVYEVLDKNYVSDATFGPIYLYKQERAEN